ncbi:hypothetical protein QJQ45_021837 [Haematococcus lacustris]|nr:hypothetical protein QJQ45_021837 [Haematococcus lacustris]
MGVVEPLPKSEDVAKCWVMATGSIISVDAVFSDWFAFKPEDLLGTYVSGLVVEGKKLEEFLKMVKAADRRFAGGVKDGAEGQSLRLDNIHIKHKFAEPMEVSLDVVNGGVGNHAFYVISVHRTGRHGRHMLVSDRRGRICHCTQELAATLGHTPHSIRMSGMQHALGQLLPEPFATLHKSYVHDSQPPLAPPYSCRAHLSVCMKVPGPEGDEHKPFKLDVKKREDLGGVNHIVNLEECTWEQALDERRLVLMTDPNGVVIKASAQTHAFALGPASPHPGLTALQLNIVSSSPFNLFGFEVSKLVGKSLADVVDGLAPGNHVTMLPRDPQLKAAALDTNKPDLAWTLMQLARRATSCPGCSWRVGVHPPEEHTLSTSHPGAGLLEQLHQRRTKPAVMVVKVHLGGALASRRASTLMPSAAIMPGSLTAEASIHGPSTVQLEVSLWRADMLSGVMELDSSGKIINVSEHKLYSPGLLWGVPSDTLVRKHISKLLPLADRPVVDLFEPGLGAYKAGAIRSKLKKSDKPVDGRLQKPGRVNLVKVKHLMDGAELELSVQVIHCYNPRAAPDNLHELLSTPVMPANARALMNQPSYNARDKHQHKTSRSGTLLGLSGRNESNLTSDDVLGSRNVSGTPRGTVITPGPDSMGAKGVRWGAGQAPEQEVVGVSVMEADEELSEAEDGVGHEDDDECDDGHLHPPTYLESTKPNEGGELQHSGSGVASDEQGSQASGSQQGDDNGPQDDNTDYRRGTRFKKLQRLLASNAGQRMIQKFKIHSLGVVAAVACLHIGLFVLVLTQLSGQKGSVTTLNKVGFAARSAITAAIAVRDVDLVLSGSTVPGLMDLSSYADLDIQLDILHKEITNFQTLHTGTFLGFESPKQLPDVKGLYQLWNTPSVVYTLFQDNPVGPPSSSKANASLWDIGNDFVKKVKSLQLVLLLAEGLGAAVLVVCYMWIITTAVANQRFNLYSVFMVLPMGLVRSLANKELMIEDVEVEVNEDFADPDMAVNQFEMAEEKGDEQANVATDNIIRINVAGLRVKHDPDSGVRRVLQRSYTSMLRHCWLFMAWGLLIIVTNALGSQRLANISAPVSTFNTCNFINIRYLRVFFTVQELANANTVASVEAIRKELGPRYQLLDREYQTMLYGAKAFPNETASHYTRVVGVLYAAGSGVDLLYRTRQALGLSVRSGVLVIVPGLAWPLNCTLWCLGFQMQTFFTAVETSIMSQDLEPSLDGDVFSTVWNMRGDTSGGLSNINKQYEASVLAVFDFVIAVHVVGLVLTLLLLLAYLAFVLKPYLKETANETKRLAELLTQLPNEVDVEGLLRASLLRLPPSNRNAKGSDADVKRPRGSLESPGGSRTLTSLDLAEGLKQTVRGFHGVAQAPAHHWLGEEGAGRLPRPGAGLERRHSTVGHTASSQHLAPYHAWPEKAIMALLLLLPVSYLISSSVALRPMSLRQSTPDLEGMAAQTSDLTQISDADTKAVQAVQAASATGVSLGRKLDGGGAVLPAARLKNLILVAGHAVYVGKDYSEASLESSWFLEPYQQLPGEAQSFVEHIRLGVLAAAEDPEAMLLFSGGQTRLAAGPRSEGLSYWSLPGRWQSLAALPGAGRVFQA